MNDPNIYVYIYIINSIIKCLQNTKYIARRPVSPLTPIGTKWVPPTLYKMGINFPIQNGLSSL
jgi:hypothetical protein